MTTLLASQLSRIAANSHNSLNLKAQKAAHSKSLIFEARVAASQGFDTLYTLCHEGFQELCLLDGRFLEFQRDIFSEQSQEQDRTQINAQQNADLDRRIESFLGLVGARLRLNPAIKAVEWLIRRFRIHEYNTSFLLTTFLPYHSLPVFTTLLSILPSRIPEDYTFLHPNIRSLTAPSRQSIVQAATTHASFAALLNSYVLQICNRRQHHPALLAFWAGIMTESVSNMMDKSRSGRRNIQQQNEQDVILRLLPTLNEGLAMKKVPDLRLGCYMVLSVVASKGGLDDRLLTAMMEAVVLGWTVDTLTPGLVCLAILSQQRSAKQLTKRLTKELLKIPNIATNLVELAKQRRVDRLANGLCLALIDRLRKDGEVNSLTIVEEIVTNSILTDPQSVVIMKSLLLAAHDLDNSSSTSKDKSSLAALLLTLTSSQGHLGSVLQGALEESGIDIDELELKLQATVRPAPRIENGEEMDVDNGTEAESSLSLKSLLDHLPKRTTTELSFLSHKPSNIYDDLCHAFLVAASNTSDLDLFDALPILHREAALQSATYLSFYTRVWCGPYPLLARVSALRNAARRLMEEKNADVDMQALLPYLVVALSDPSPRVRRAAADLVVAINEAFPLTESKKKSKQHLKWAAADLYGPDKGDSLKWLTPDVASKLITDVLIGALEECVLDDRHLENVFPNCLGKSNAESPKKNETVRLPQAARTSIMAFLASHAAQTPLLTAKYRLLRSLNSVRSVAGASRTKFLLPILQSWLRSEPAVTLKWCKDEMINPVEMNDEVLAIITATDKDGIHLLESIIKGEVAVSDPGVSRAAYSRLRKIWSVLKEESILHLAQLLLDISQIQNQPNEDLDRLSNESAEFLRTTTLSSDVLSAYLEQLPTASKLADKAPATKRRRTSHGEVARTPLQDPEQLAAAIKKVTFVLQLIHSSQPGSHPELLRGLFNTLAELQHFKAQVASELAYLQGLVLECLLAILQTHKTKPGYKVDKTAIRADLLVDCIQKTTSPQVQNAALLLVASLAESSPELVLHSVMPIFTFIGSSVLRQNDEYSAHVITQTIREVIPPLITSLRKDKGNPVVAAAELLLSFVAAYEHVPSHRRKGLFISLVQTMGPEDFLFALLAMLVDKYGSSADVQAFTVEISSHFSVETQLQTYMKNIDLIVDVLKPKPSYSSALLGANEEGLANPHRLVATQLDMLPNLLAQKKLVTQTAKLLDRDDMDAARVRDIYASLLEKVLTLADSVKGQEDLHNACGDVLESLLGLLSTSEFVKSVESLLDRPNESLRRKILRSLEVRIEQESAADASSRTAMLSFLPQLTAIIRESKDVIYKQIAVACVDKISEKYGKKDIEAVAAAAETIASSHCLGQSDPRLRVMALLCLASLVDILREGVVSVLPSAIPTCLDYMEGNISTDVEAQKLHNAGFAFISSLIEHLPYMISGGYLEKLLKISNLSAEADLDEEADENRMQCLQLAAKQIDAKSMFTALEKNWERAVKLGPLAAREHLQVLSIAVEKHPKSVVTRYSSLLAGIFQNAFDLRRQWSVVKDPSFTTELADIETSINNVAIKMIYKLNDATFRPIFGKLVDWAASGLPKKDILGRTLRLQSLYGFMEVFFDNLKSIVTSYATYLVDNAVDVLKNVNTKDEESRELWTRVLRTLQKSFEHDQDDFWQSPTHFDAVMPVLCAQFTHASSLPLVMELVPTVVELAAAADSAEHHKELNSAILKHMRSESGSVRLAAVKCEQELTDRLGEEWLSMLAEMLPFISELQEDDDDMVERETHRWIVKIEGVLGESLDSMLQ